MDAPPPTPPPKLERLVLALIPPLAREAVAGDLCETYHSPRQYAVEALRTVPFVIASQMRRNLNIPALAPKLALAWFFLGGTPAILLLPLLMLADAWQPAARPDAHSAIRETMTVGLMAMILVQALSMNIGFMLQTGLSRSNWLSLYLFGFLVAPLLCLLRTGMILHHDRHASTPGRMSAGDLAETCRLFVRRARLHNIVEGAALVAAAGLALLLLGPSSAFVLTALYLLTAIYLLMRGAPRPMPGGRDFRSVLAWHARALVRQRQLRRFMWWLWCAPLLMALQARMAHGSLTAAISAALLLLLCFLLAAINREHGGRVQEEIGALDRMRQVTG